MSFRSKPRLVATWNYYKSKEKYLSIKDVLHQNLSFQRH